jgi:hypothetical protein
MQNSEGGRVWNGDHTQPYQLHAGGVHLPPIQAFSTQTAPSHGQGSPSLPGFTQQWSAMMQEGHPHTVHQYLPPGPQSPTYGASSHLMNPPHPVVSSFHLERPGVFHPPNPNPAAQGVPSYENSLHPVHSTSTLGLDSVRAPSAATQVAWHASEHHTIHQNQGVDIREHGVEKGAGTESNSPVSSMNPGASISRPSSGVSALSEHDSDQGEKTGKRPWYRWSPTPEIDDSDTLKLKEIMEAEKQRVESLREEEGRRDGSEGSAKTGGNADNLGDFGGGSENAEGIQPGSSMTKATSRSVGNRGRGGSNRGGSRRGGKSGKGAKAAPAEEQVAQLEPELLKTLDTPAQKVRCRTWTVEEMDALATYITSEKVWKNFKVNQSRHFGKVSASIVVC